MNLDEKIQAILQDEEESILPTLKERAADVVSKFGGSWSFIIVFMLFCGSWCITNLVFNAFDNFPFILLNLILSCISVFQAPFILMSQNRMADIDRKRAENDYKINLKSELEIEEIQETLKRIIEILNNK